MTLTSDRRVIAALEARGVAYCVIGATAMSAWGYARFTADVDLLTMDARVLDSAFWTASGLGDQIEAIRRGDDDDPLEGLARFKPQPCIDVIVGRGSIMREAVADAVEVPAFGWRVARPLSIALMKLEAGGNRDRLDLVEFIRARQMAEPARDFRAAIEARLAELSDWGRRAWARVCRDLDEP